MLYEVITSTDSFDFAQARQLLLDRRRVHGAGGGLPVRQRRPALARVRSRRVITSYSIHYTKLYDTVERLLTDLHSGRIVPAIGVRFMDLVGVFLVVLSATGILLWARGSRNGKRKNN